MPQTETGTPDHGRRRDAPLAHRLLHGRRPAQGRNCGEDGGLHDVVCLFGGRGERAIRCGFLVRGSRFCRQPDCPARSEYGSPLIGRTAMEIFADTADVREIETWLGFGVLDGATTNPSIMLAGGEYQLHEGAVKIARLLGDRPLSVEVVTDDRDEMYDQASEFATWAPNIVVKIPVITTQGEPCLGVISRLSRDGVKVNATACLSFNQAMLAAKAGATYVSLFAGRISDEGTNSFEVIRNTAMWLKAWGMPTKIIVGSIRETINVQDAALAGAHVV